jgi:hypothetical protein
MIPMMWATVQASSNVHLGRRNSLLIIDVVVSIFIIQWEGIIFDGVNWRSGPADACTGRQRQVARG